jgi:hypothetical protein
MNDKIYCNTCKWNGCRRSYNYIDPDLCYYPDNLQEIEEENYFEKTKTQIHRKMAHDINKNNNCKWFEKIEVLF